MPIYKGTLKTGAAYKGNVSLQRIYKGAYLVFEAFKTLIAEGVPPITLLNCAAEIMLGYKIYGNSKQQLLPDGYTQLEYIRATGTQYIDTGVAYDDTSIEVNFIGTIETNSTLFGIRRSGRVSNTFKISAVSNKIRASKYDENCDTDLSMSSSIIYNFILNNNIFSVDGTTLYSFSNSAYTTNFNLYLFAEDVISTDGSSSTAEAKSSAKCYACKIYKNNVIIRNFVPCKNSSNIIGLYDTVNNVFYTNAGTGTFTAGSTAIVPTPDSPIEIESVGDESKNLWNTTLVPGCRTFANGTYVDTYPSYVVNSSPIRVEAGETYTLTIPDYTPDGDSAGFVFFNEGTFVSSYHPASGDMTVTIPSGVNQLYYNIRKLGAPAILPSDFSNIQLEKGSSGTSYETPGYRIPVTISGQNVIDMSDAQYDFDEPISMWAATLFNNTKTKKYLKPNTTYTISYDVECTSVPAHTEGFDNRYGFFLFSGVSGHPSIIMYQYGYLSVGDKNSYISTFTTPANLYDNDADYRILGYSNLYKNGDTNVSSSMQFSNIQIVEGSYTAETMPAYEPYYAPRTTDIYLSEPLRKLGNYADYIDFETGKVVRKINYNQVTGLFNEITRYTNYSRYGGYQFSPRNTINLNVEKCNYLPYRNAPNGFYVGANTGASFYLYDDVTGVTAEDDTGAKRTAKAVAWLRSLSPRLMVYYVLETETEETVTLPDILLNKGTNIISVDTTTQPSNMLIKYKGK